MLSENEIANAIESQNRLSGPASRLQVSEFETYKDPFSGCWVVCFIYLDEFNEKKEGKLHRKRGGYVREFKRLSGVEAWMKKVGVRKFTVFVLTNPG